MGLGRDMQTKRWQSYHFDTTASVQFIRISMYIMKATVKRLPLTKQTFNEDSKHNDGIFEQLRSDYWLVKGSLDEANKRIEFLESVCSSCSISIPHEMPF